MSEDPPRRPILKLKFAPAPKPPPEPLPAPVPSPSFRKPARFAPRPPPAPPPPPPPAHSWKCKPCGAGVTPSPDLADEDSVRCPACNARLGLAKDFRADPPLLEKLRARPAKR